jgi:hypothetical protein
MPVKSDYDSGKPFKNLKDYSGPFIPDIRYEDFTKEFLAKQWNTIGRLFLLTDGAWVRYVTNKWGQKEALDADIDVWKKIGEYEHRLMPDSFGIKERDLEALCKVMQLDPGWPFPFFHVKYDLNKKKDVARAVCEDCGVVRYWERIGDTAGLKRICHEVEVGVFGHYCNLFNPNIEVKPIKLPPRKGPDDVPHCIWEFTYKTPPKK